MNLQLNYHHLRYFLAVAEQGGIQAASQAFHVSGPTLSSQVRELESYLGVALFRRERRRLVLTEAGLRVRRYAERITNLGDELVESMQRSVPAEEVHLGIVDSVPKLFVSRILRSAWKQRPDLRVVVREGLSMELLPALAGHQVDLVIATDPVPASFRPIVHGQRALAFDVRFAVSVELRGRYRKRKGLTDFPVLLPTREASLRRELDRWWAEEGIRPRIRAEFDDAAAMYELASEGAGAAPVFGSLMGDVKRRYGLVPLPVRPPIQEDLYLITASREFSHEGAELLARIIHEFA
jgi:LysR family transcriptional activator of nhaA